MTPLGLLVCSLVATIGRQGVKSAFCVLFAQCCCLLKVGNHSFIVVLHKTPYFLNKCTLTFMYDVCNMHVFFSTFVFATFCNCNFLLPPFFPEAGKRCLMSEGLKIWDGGCKRVVI